MAALKKALAEAEDKAAKERTAREEHEARVSKAQQELQDAVEKFESLERDFKTQKSELAKARQSAQDAQAEAQSALQEIQAAKEIVAGKYFTMQSKYVKETFLVLTRIWAFQGCLRICRAAYQMLPSFIELKRGCLRRSYSGLNMLDPNIQYPLATS